VLAGTGTRPRASAAFSSSTWLLNTEDRALSAAHLPAPTPFDSPGFARLWTTFMWARVLIALTILALQVAIHLTVRPAPPWLLVLCGVYLGATALVPMLAKPHGPGAHLDMQWLYAVGVDLAFVGTLQFTQAGGINYTPLLALPVLMASTMGTRMLALGTAALVTLMMLGHALWLGGGQMAAAAELGQAGLIGAGLLALSGLTNQLSSRLAREENLARRGQAEARMQTLVNHLVIEAMPDGVLVVDARQKVRAANPAARAMLGAAPSPVPRAFTLHDDPAWAPLVQVARDTLTQGPLESAEVTLRRAEQHGGRLQVHTRRTPSFGAGGQGLCVMFLQDLRVMEARLRTEKLAAMGRMSAAVAHEIRNPLAAIVQANALLAEEILQPTQQRLTRIVEQNAQRLGHIVDDVLNVVRVPAQGEAVSGPPLDLDTEAAAFCQEWAHQHHVGDRLVMRWRAGGQHVQFARDHLRRVLVNLLDNAARHASTRPGAIQVATHAEAPGPVTLLVWSDGPPLEASVQRHLFEPFFSSESRSSGLGLFICRELCQRHGASIAHERAARPREDQATEGNEFFVHFLRAAATAVSAATPRP
jgi:two-component system sensor histidine kinase PilS (NtrC family)